MFYRQGPEEKLIMMISTMNGCPGHKVAKGISVCTYLSYRTIRLELVLKLN